MREFPQAEYIFKLDEDIYLPQGYFDDMVAAYDLIEKILDQMKGNQNERIYFNKRKTNYYILGTLKRKYINNLLNLIISLESDNKIKIITSNL